MENAIEELKDIATCITSKNGISEWINKKVL